MRAILRCSTDNFPEYWLKMHHKNEKKRRNRNGAHCCTEMLVVGDARKQITAFFCLYFTLSAILNLFYSCLFLISKRSATLLYYLRTGVCLFAPCLSSHCAAIFVGHSIPPIGGTLTSARRIRMNEYLSISSRRAHVIYMYC